MKIVLAGMICRDPGQGGATWAVLNWALGLLTLGHDVILVEQLPQPPTRRQSEYALHLGRSYDLDVRVFSGAAPEELRTALAGTDLLVNLSGVLRDEALMAAIPRRMYVDLDPAFTQAWATDGVDMGLAGHTAHVTVGLAVGTPASLVPDAGVRWLTTVPPVVPERWGTHDRLPVRLKAATSVGHWRSYGTAAIGGQALGQRAHSVRELIDLPSRTRMPIRLALGISPQETADLRALDANGWMLADPAKVAGTPGTYRRFVAGSLAEIGIAKQGYVVSRSGWFSDRSVCYLAAGRPVVAQDTGFSAHLPVGEGLLAFHDTATAAAALDDVQSNWERHSAAARRVLGRLLDEVTG
jgi:hypothetical protein